MIFGNCESKQLSSNDNNDLLKINPGINPFLGNMSEFKITCELIQYLDFFFFYFLLDKLRSIGQFIDHCTHPLNKITFFVFVILDKLKSIGQFIDHCFPYFMSSHRPICLLIASIQPHPPFSHTRTFCSQF